MQIVYKEQILLKQALIYKFYNPHMMIVFLNAHVIHVIQMIEQTDLMPCLQQLNNTTSDILSVN